MPGPHAKEGQRAGRGLGDEPVQVLVEFLDLALKRDSPTGHGAKRDFGSLHRVSSTSGVSPQASTLARLDWRASFGSC